MAQQKTKRRKEPPCVTEVPPTVRYETDETPKRKHHWERNEPGFVELPPNSGIKVGKCPSGLSNDEAERLLARGVGFNPPRWSFAHVERIYVVHRGTVYRATVTNSATPSYHGFPELPGKFPKSRELRDAVLQRAQEEGADSLDRVRKWLASE